MIKTKTFAEDTEIVRSDLSITYNQAMGSEGQELHLYTEVYDHEVHSFTMETKKWTFDSIDEIIEVLQDFKNKVGS